MPLWLHETSPLVPTVIRGIPENGISGTPVISEVLLHRFDCLKQPRLSLTSRPATQERLPVYRSDGIVINISSPPVCGYAGMPSTAPATAALQFGEEQMPTLRAFSATGCR